MHSVALFVSKACSDSKRVKTLIPLMGDFAHVSSDLPACARTSEADAKTCSKPGVECGGMSWAKATRQSGVGAMRAFGAERRGQKIPSGGTKV